MTVLLKADDSILDIVRQAYIDENGLTLTGQLDRQQYKSVNKFLAVAGADWNRKAKRHLFRPGAKERIEALLANGELRDDKKHFQSFYTPTALAAEVIAIADIRHVIHAFKFLKPGGKLVAIMAKGWMQGESRVRADFRDFLAIHGSVIKEVPEGTFKESGTNIAAVLIELRADG